MKYSKGFKDWCHNRIFLYPRKYIVPIYIIFIIVVVVLTFTFVDYKNSIIVDGNDKILDFLRQNCSCLRRFIVGSIICR